LGETVVHRLLCFTLYLLGVNRRAIGEALGIPCETAKSIIKAVGKNGLSALEDRRHRISAFLPQAPAALAPVSLSSTEEHIIVDFGAKDRRLRIPRQNKRQVRAVLLSLVSNRLLPKDQVAKALGLSVAHASALSQRLHSEGISALIDKRQGQQSDYRITPEVKAELVQQFAADVIARGRTSGEAISTELRDRCQITVPARTVRHHLARMGLGRIKQSLPELIAAVKKTSVTSS
jgi:transposase